MKASVNTPEVFFNRNIRLEIPCYQRPYSWGKEEGDILFDDIITQAEMIKKAPNNRPTSAAHFLSSLNLIPVEGPEVGINYYYVIDGQQRTTSLSVLMTVLAHFDCKMNNVPASQFDACIKRPYGNDTLKFMPSSVDSATWLALNEDPSKADRTSLLTQAYLNFYNRFQDYLKKGGEFQHLATAITQRLEFVVIEMDDSCDQNQLFYSINNKGLDLTQADMVRNQVFAELKELGNGQEKKFFAEQWRPFEKKISLGNEAALSENLEKFLHIWCQRQARTQFGDKFIYERFSKLVNAVASDAKGSWSKAEKSQAFFLEMLQAAEAFQVMSEPNYLTGNASLRDQFKQLKNYGYEDAWDVLNLELWQRYLDSAKSEKDTAGLKQCFNILERYLCRRALAGFGSKAYNRIALEICNMVRAQKDKSMQEIAWSIDNDLTKRETETDKDPSREELLEGMVARKVGIGKKALEAMMASLLNLGGIPGDVTLKRIIPNKRINGWGEYIGEENFNRFKDSFANFVLFFSDEVQGWKEDKTFDEKKLWLCKSEIDSTAWVGNQLKWSEKQITQRAIVLLGLVDKQWPELKKYERAIA